MMTTGTTMTIRQIVTKRWYAKYSATYAGLTSITNGRLIRLFMMLIGRLVGVPGMSAKA